MKRINPLHQNSLLSIKKKAILKTDMEKKDKEPTDMASMQRVLKQIRNELIDLKKAKERERNLSNHS